MIESAVSTDWFDSELKLKCFVNKNENKWWWTI